MEENYIKKYYEKENHDFSSILKLNNIEKDTKIMTIKKEVNKLLKELEEKGNELSKEVANAYSSKYSPIKEDIIIHYSSRSYNGGDIYFNLDNGLIVDDIDNKENVIIYKVDKKKGEFKVVVGYDYDLASIIVRKYRYNIINNNSKMTTKIVSESVISFLDNKMATIYFEDTNYYLKGDIQEKEISIYNDLEILKNIKDNYFINNLFGVDYKGKYNLYELKNFYMSNKSFEIILKTSPKEVVDDLLKIKGIEKALPIHKILGITIDTYNMAMERGIIKNVVVSRNFIKNKLGEEYKVNKTEKEWLDFIEEIKRYEEDLGFYNISYADYYYHNYENEDNLLEVMYGHYVDSSNAVLRKYYSLGKLTNYVVNETINQGYERIKDFIEELEDYLKMCEHEGIKPTLYSSYLRMTHDIAKRNHKIIVEKENEEIFKSRYKDFKTYVGRKYKVYAPQSSIDLKKEGDNLNHCVASYIKRVIDGECLIFFLRKEKEESLITFEVRNNVIMQVKGLHNRKPIKDEILALQDFAKCRNMEVNF